MQKTKAKFEICKTKSIVHMAPWYRLYFENM